MDTNKNIVIPESTQASSQIVEDTQATTSTAQTPTSSTEAQTEQTPATTSTALSPSTASTPQQPTAEVSKTATTPPAAQASTTTVVNFTNTTPTALEIKNTLAHAKQQEQEQEQNGSPLDGYLEGGYFKGEGKSRYIDPALVDQAETIGKGLAAGGVTPTAFNRMYRTLKDTKKLPREAQAGAFKKMLTEVTDQENRKKAPPLLREVVERNRAAVQTEADFAACLDHFRDISIYLAAQPAAAETTKK